MEVKLQLLPAEPGVYLMKDRHSRVLYVGKAGSLKNRVRSYFQITKDLKMQRLMREVCDFEYIVTRTEREALLLEAALIKKHQPRYNVKGDKGYPYIKLTSEPFPKLELVRERDGAKCFGPYISSETVRETLKLLQKIFKLRTCNLSIEQPPVRKRPCLDHYIGLCDAPCVGAISEDEYERLVEGAALFLRGRSSDLLAQLRRQMEEAAAKLEFERAARLRDTIHALERLRIGQQETTTRPIERDLIAYAVAPAHGHVQMACVQVFFMRGGKLVGRESFFLETPPSTSGTEIITAFVKQYYESATQIPKEILVPCELDEPEAIAGWLSERRGAPVKLREIARGPQRKLLDLVAHNAALALRELTAQAAERADETALYKLQHALKLDAPPRRIEAYDISNFQGRSSVGSMVVFYDGKPKKSAYRRFRIETVSGIDDFSMIAEIVKRRLERGLAGDERFLPFPDLILIDGGKGQLGAARAVMRKLGLEKIPTVALAKEFEHLFVEGRSRPLILPKVALHLVQLVRDEAHRFALSYHRILRKREFLTSALDEISGIGPKRKQHLLEGFGSLQALKRATLKELQTVLSPTLAQRLYRALHSAPNSGTDGSSETHR